ncbi:exported hypothetical protein [Candidatus Zixiibacteriota bacterium]|nr:exported hypothetical protein [candidate division Zixibacteria bacterium]
MKKAIACSLILLSVAGSSAMGKAYRFEFEKNIETGNRAELSVSNISGRIEIAAAAVDKVTINAVKNVRAVDAEEAEKIADRIEIRVSRTDHQVTVETNYLKGGPGSRSLWERLFGSGEDSYGDVDYTITVPYDCRTEIDNVSGEVFVTGTKSSTYISTTSGGMRLQDITGLIDVETVSGEIELDNIKGDVSISATSSEARLSVIDGIIDIHTTSGETRADDIRGPITISETSGDVTLNGMNGDVRIKSISGDINIQQESGAIDIITQSGTVRVRSELDSRKEYYVETTSGTIDFLVPETSSGSVRIETVSGAIETRLDMTARVSSRTKFTGEFGKGGPKISLMSMSGDIVIGKF